MDYAALQTFVVLCETGNITRTAELLYKTQPAISNRIRQLEEELGFSLVVRHKGRKTVSVTAKGEEFLRIARRLLDAYSEIETVREQLSRSLTVSSIASVMTPIVTDICKRMMGAVPGLRISLLTYQTEDAYRMVAEKKLDIAFVSDARIGPEVRCEPVFQQKYYVVRCDPAPGPPRFVTTAGLDPSKEIYQEWTGAYRLWHRQKFGEGRYPVQVDSCTVLMEFLRDSDCWAIIQQQNLDEIKRHIPVQVYQLRDAPPARVCYMITSSNPDPGSIPLLREFREETRRCAAEGGFA